MHDSIGDMSLFGLLKDCGAETVSQDAATEFYGRYMDKLMSLVERNLATRFQARFDPEDVVQSVFRTWFRRTGEGRIDPGSKDEIWKLISVIALNKVRNKVKFHDAKLRAVSKTKANDEILAAVPEPSEQDATDFLDLVEAAGKSMSDNARRTLELILEGRSASEIAGELERTTKSVTRYKKEIGTVLEQLLERESTDQS